MQPIELKVGNTITLRELNAHFRHGMDKSITLRTNGDGTLVIQNISNHEIEIANLRELFNEISQTDDDKLRDLLKIRFKKLAGVEFETAAKHCNKYDELGVKLLDCAQRIETVNKNIRIADEKKMHKKTLFLKGGLNDLQAELDDLITLQAAELNYLLDIQLI